MLPTTGAPEWAPAQATPWDTVNKALRIHDSFMVKTIVESRSETAPPGSCDDGDVFLVDSPATGVWYGEDGRLAIALGANAANGWYYATIARKGAELFVVDEDVYIEFDGAAWVLRADAVRTLDDLEDVDLTGLSDGDSLVYDASAGQFYPGAVSTSGGGGGGGGSAPPFMGALVVKTVNQSGANFSGGAVIPWDDEVYDEGGFHDNSTNNSRLTVPDGVTKVRLSGQIQMGNVTSNTAFTAVVFKNGAGFVGMPEVELNLSDTFPRCNLHSAVVDVVPGDYFELRLDIGDSNIDIIAGESWFCIETVEVALAPGTAPIQTEGGDYTLAPGDVGNYIRMTDASAKALTIDPESTTAQPAAGEWHIRNAGAGDLTITEGSGVTVNPPADGTLVLAEGMTATLKRVDEDEYDLLGQTVPA